MLIVVVSRLLIVLFSMLIAWIGLKWHIGFTVQTRYSWGMKGSFIPLSQRILLNFVWNAVQCTLILCIKSEERLTSARLEWWASRCSLLDGNMALLRTHAKHIWVKYAYHN